jgi:hypothetical protein
MRLRSRLGLTVATGVLGIVGLLGVAACSPGATAPTAASATMSAEATALTALGFTDGDVTTDGTAANAADGPTSPAPNASATPHRPRHPGLRRMLIRRATMGRHVEHGSVTIQTKNGDETIDVQRGSITAINATTMTVKSADGFTLTWTFGSNMRVIENRGTIQPSDVKVGETVGVAGLKNGSTETARLVIIPKQ